MRKYITHPLTIFIVAIHAIYFLIAFKIGNFYLVDSYGYLNQVKNMLEHQSWYAEDWNAPVLIDYFTIRPPLYALFILVCKSIFASDIFVLFVQNLLSIFNLFLLWKMLDNFGVKQKIISISLITAMLLFPSQFIHANFVMSEILFQTLLMLIFWFTVKVMQSKKIIDVLLVSVFICLAMITKPVAIFFGLVLFIFYISIFWKQNKKIAIPFLLIPVTYHLMCLQNQHVTGLYHFSSSKTIVDVRVNVRTILAIKYGQDSSDKYITALNNQASKFENYKARTAFIEKNVYEVYQKNKVTFFLLYVKGMLGTLLDPGRFDLSVFFNLQNASANGILFKTAESGFAAIPQILKSTPPQLLIFLLIILLWNIVLVFSIFHFMFNKSIAFYMRILVLLFISYMVVTTGISGVCRYRVPIFPEIIFAFTVAVSQLVHFFQKRTHA